MQLVVLTLRGVGKRIVEVADTHYMIHDQITASLVYLYWVYMGMERLEYWRFSSRDIWTDSWGLVRGGGGDGLLLASC